MSSLFLAHPLWAVAVIIFMIIVTIGLAIIASHLFDISATLRHQMCTCGHLKRDHCKERTELIDPIQSKTGTRWLTHPAACSKWDCFECYEFHDVALPLITSTPASERP